MELSRDIQFLVLVALHTVIDAAGFSPEMAYTGNLALDDTLEYPGAETFDSVPMKRLSKFVRIGRGLSSFVRIGKSDPDLEQSFDTEGSQDGEVSKRKSAFVRIGRGDFEEPDKRMSKFVRIGRDLEDMDDPYYGYSKRGAAILRMGKFPLSAFFRQRSGRLHSLAPQPYYRRSGRIGKSSFIRIGKRAASEAQTQLDDGNEEERRYLRLGKELGAMDGEDQKQESKRLSSFVRIGRSDALNGNDYAMSPLDKRLSSFVRIGRGDMDKRLSSFVRIGKSYGVPADEMSKRLSKFVRIGKNTDSEYPIDAGEKRALSKFVRIGRQSLLSGEPLSVDGSEIDKRPSTFVRIGKSLAKSHAIQTSDNSNSASGDPEEDARMTD